VLLAVALRAGVVSGLATAAEDCTAVTGDECCPGWPDADADPVPDAALGQ
jgi:hypothetical protein